MTITETRLEIKSWDEKPYRELPDGSRYTRADVELAGTGPDPTGQADLSEASSQMLSYTRADGTSAYVTLMSVTGTLAGRHGTFVLVGDGTYDGTTARGDSRIVDATGELAGLTGTAVSASTHADYPYMPLRLTYELA